MSEAFSRHFDKEFSKRAFPTLKVKRDKAAMMIRNVFGDTFQPTVKIALPFRVEPFMLHD